jgi:hypothetical protein
MSGCPARYLPVGDLSHGNIFSGKEIGRTAYLGREMRPTEFRSGLAAGVDLELRKDSLGMVPRGMLADVERAGNRLVGTSLA